MRLDARTATHYEAKKTRSGSEMYKLDRRSAERMTWNIADVGADADADANQK
jgi:hypothetical protein